MTMNLIESYREEI